MQLGVPSIGPARPPLRILTYNTAARSGPRAPQADFAELAPLRAVVAGAPDAPLVALQETGDALKARLEQLAKARGTFTVRWSRMTVNSGLLLVVPRRFAVESSGTDRLWRGNARGVWSRLKDMWRARKSFKELALAACAAFVPPAVQRLALRDRVTGERVTVFNTHVSSKAQLTAPQLEQLMATVGRVPGKVLVLGDLNTPTTDTVEADRPEFRRSRAAMAKAGLRDLGPTGVAGVSLPGRRVNIDYVLGKGFKALGGEMQTGDRLSLGPARLNAGALSDHVAELDVVAYD